METGIRLEFSKKIRNTENAGEGDWRETQSRAVVV
jgi:hypothetical protein